MVHRTEVLNRTLVSNRYFYNHFLNFLKPLKSTETLLIKKTQQSHYTQPPVTPVIIINIPFPMIRPHLFPGTGYSTEVTPGIFAGAPLGGGPPRCRDWTSNQNSLLKLKYSPWLNAFYIHMYIDTKKWNMSQFDQQLRYKWRNELQGELQFKELQKRSKKNLSFGGIQICEISAIPLFSTHLSGACLISGHISLGQHLGI